MIIDDDRLLVLVRRGFALHVRKTSLQEFVPGSFHPRWDLVEEWVVWWSIHRCTRRLRKLHELRQFYSMKAQQMDITIAPPHISAWRSERGMCPGPLGASAGSG